MTDQPTRLAPAAHVDLDAWLEGVELPTEDVTVYSKASAVARHAELNEQLALAKLRAERQRNGEQDEERSMGEEGAQADVDRLTAAIDANYQDMKASGRTFTLAALTMDEYDRLIEENQGDAKGFAIQSIGLAAKPELSVDQVERLRKRLPMTEFNRLLDTVTRLTNGGVHLPL